jgi:hypothetical protein
VVRPGRGCRGRAPGAPAALFDANGALLYDGNEDGTWYYYPVSSVALTGTAWRDYRYELGAGTERPIPPGARFMAVGAILNYNGGNRTYQITDLAIRQLPGAPADTALSLLNGWTNYGSEFHPAGYARDATGHVHLRGLVRNGTMSADIAELPVGYRPGKRCLFTTQSHADALGRIDVFPDGSVYAHGGNNVWINLEGITFLAEQ